MAGNKLFAQHVLLEKSMSKEKANELFEDIRRKHDDDEIDFEAPCDSCPMLIPF